VTGNTPATLYYNGGVASDEDRRLYSGGLQTDASYEIGDKHTVRGGLMVMGETVSADTATTVFNVDGNNNIQTSPEYPTGERTICQNNTPDAIFYGMYLQDERKLTPKLTFNYGTRFDLYASSFDDENQVSPRANLVYQPTDRTTLHAGYSRYFTPPPLETVPAGNIAEFNGTSGASQYTGPIDNVKAERANYYDIGASQKITSKLTLGVDAYYKTAQQQLDDGLFGQSLILSSFNYADGRIGGVEFTGNYTDGGWSTYANIAYSEAKGTGASSAQFLWGDNATADYVNNHWIWLDHDQRITGSFGTSYLWQESSRQSMLAYVDALYGTGLHQNGPDTIEGDPNDPIPNGSTVPAYYTLNLGVEQTMKIGVKNKLKARLDVVNVTDNTYELRSGTGVGVNAAQYGMRRGLFGSVSFVF
jgi:outer membrane receptor protein involved in Fe transport